ncbi:Hypothetical predicted protein [Mytilus galloprovincialis]|uniref:Uncharacterized protein n=1 Tax=Mytilus galloprovincialis TaxID=29158 RepID=A0A8B6EX24_MYTGA|nr:Hypothetical predicted protein [Mytilus galloprovincialis]
MTMYIIKFRGSRLEWNRFLETTNPAPGQYNFYKQKLKLDSLEQTKEMVAVIEGMGVEFLLIHPDPYPSPEEERERREEKDQRRRREYREKAKLHRKRKEAERRRRDSA